MSRYWLFKGTELITGPNENAAKASNHMDHKARGEDWNSYTLVCHTQERPGEPAKWTYYRRDYSNGWNRVHDPFTDQLQLILFLSGESL